MPSYFCLSVIFLDPEFHGRRDGDKPEVLARNDLGEAIKATPALVGGKLYVRTAGHLYAFGE